MEDIRPKPEPFESPEEADLRLEEEHRDRVSLEISDQLEVAYKAVSDILESEIHPGKKKLQ